MKINEVESCVGITKKNIRFYESEGLLAPRRNSENGYREYGDEDIETLRQIKLLRKLGFPIEEIRKMQSGELTVPDGMDRHRVALERESKNIDQSIALCEKLSQCGARLSDIDAGEILGDIARLEESGATFKNNYEKDRKINMYSSVAIAFLVIAVFLGVLWFAIFEISNASQVPMFVMMIAVVVSICAIMAVGFVLVLRLKEITKGEIEKAKRY